MSVWSELRKKQKNTPSNWTEAAPQPTKPVENTPVKVDNLFPSGTISFDLETGSVTEMFRTSDPGFIRLSGWDLDGGPVQTDAMPLTLLKDLAHHDGWIIGHNIMNFDCLLLDKLHGLSILALAQADRLRDTKLLAFLADPPYSRTKEGEIEKMYSLQNVGTKYLGEGKMVDVATGSSVLKVLANRHGGFDKIPVDDPDYNEYLRRDVEVTRDLCKVLPITDYACREHKIAAVASTISIQGFRVDEDLLRARIRAGEDKRETVLGSLVAIGLPGPETTKAPHRTNAGIQAIDVAFKELGVTLPRTATGRPGLGKDVLQEVIASAERSAVEKVDFGAERTILQEWVRQSVPEVEKTQEVIDLAEAILSLNGIRTIYANILDNLVGDRVHPSINLRQSTGRWSIQNPGLTVVGKRGGKVVEREVFLPDEGCILISCDLAQVDARAVAGLSQDREYLKLFEPGQDLHAQMAIRLFGDVTKRELAKAGVHGVNYGMRSKKLALTTGMSDYDAETFIHEFEKNFPVLTAWQWKVREEGETAGVLYNGYGRMMRIEPNRSFTQSPALMGQSTARDILCQGILNLWNVGGEDVIRMVRAVVHDELVLSVPEDDIDEIEHLVVDAMSFEWCPAGGTYPVSITAGLNQRGVNWADCYRKN